MRLIERIHEYLAASGITAYEFEHACGLSNGYVGKQLKGKGSVGSDILEKIKRKYTDLSLVWLVTGKGKMILTPPDGHAPTITSELNEEQSVYFTSKDEVIKLLNKQVARLEQVVLDKDKIIALLEEQAGQRPSRGSGL